MPPRGNNLPGFLETQLAFTAHVRNPDAHPRPTDVEPRRMQIYLDLIFNNIESFLASGFPIAKRVLDGDRWRALVRRFVHQHASSSPYFLEVTQEFLTFLDDCDDDDVPDFLLELCHYEWVELALSTSEVEIPREGIDPSGDLLSEVVVVSPLIWCLSYRYPVHQIGKSFMPDQPPESPTQLVVYRRADDQVKFLSVNAVTIRLVSLLEQELTGSAALDDLIRELASESAQMDEKTVYDQGIATLEKLREAEILLGTRI